MFDMFDADIFLSFFSKLFLHGQLVFYIGPEPEPGEQADDEAEVTVKPLRARISGVRTDYLPNANNPKL